MITVYGYGFEVPAPAEPPSTPWGTYALVTAVGWWMWKKWGSGPSARSANPHHRRRRRNPDPRKAWRGFKMGERVRVGKRTGVIVGQPTGVWSSYRVRLDNGQVKDYAIRSVRPA